MELFAIHAEEPMSKCGLRKLCSSQRMRTEDWNYRMRLSRDIHLKTRDLKEKYVEKKILRKETLKIK